MVEIRLKPSYGRHTSHDNIKYIIGMIRSSFVNFSTYPCVGANLKVDNHTTYAVNFSQGELQRLKVWFQGG